MPPGGGADERLADPNAVLFAVGDRERGSVAVSESEGPCYPTSTHVQSIRRRAPTSTMTEDELTVDDFVENDLPHRPLKYYPQHRTELRRFAVLAGGLFVLLAGLGLML